MAQNDDRYIPRVPNNLNEVADLLRDIWEVLHALEGRVGPISLRDDLSVMGGVTATGDLETNVTTDGSVELDNYLQINERVFDAEGVLTPDVAPLGSSRIYQDPISDTLKVSQNGAAYVDLVSSTPTATTPRCRIFNSANISIPDSTLTTLTFDSERYDTDTMHAGGAPSRITFTTGGVYSVGACVEFAATAATALQVRLVLNGTTRIAMVADDGGGAADQKRFNPSTEYSFAAGDFVEVIVFQNSGGALNVDVVGNYSPEFWASLVPAKYVV